MAAKACFLHCSHWRNNGDYCVISSTKTSPTYEPRTCPYYSKKR